MELQIINIRRFGNFISKTEIKKAVSTALQRCGKNTKEPYEITVIFVDKEEIRKMNRQYRNIDRATDVISFAFCEGEGAQFAPFLLGDVAVCMDVVEDHSKKYGTGLKKEIIFVIVHGLLHLLGYDHNAAGKRKKMREKEEEIMEVLFS